MDWIESQGGPLLLLEESLLLLWEGADAPSAARIVQAQSRSSPTETPTDYDRACDIRRMLGTIEVGGHTALVLAGEPLPSAWWPNADGISGIIVRWRYANSEEDIINAIAQVSEDLFSGPALNLSVNGATVLFDSAMPGYDIATPLLRITIPNGEYAIRTLTYEPDDDMSLVLHRFGQIAP